MARKVRLESLTYGKGRFEGRFTLAKLGVVCGLSGRDGEKNRRQAATELASA
jgi:hypothetical protein